MDRLRSSWYYICKLGQYVAMYLQDFFVPVVLEAYFISWFFR